MNLVFLSVAGLLTFVLRKCGSIDIDDIPFSNCTNGSYCDEPTINNDVELSNTTEIDKKFLNDTTYTTTESIEYTTTEKFDKTTSKTHNHSDICTCDITASLCDANCCCDPDCNDEISLSGLNFSQRLNVQRKIYDSRYCYTKNFIHRNNTQFILERLASNLFCIAYDNLPPIYGIKDTLDIIDRADFEKAKITTYPNKYSWKLSNLGILSPEFNSSSNYRVTDVLWKYKNNIVTIIELPQAGFTAECKFRKILKYGETSKWTCMQTRLENDNKHLFPDAYINFTVITSPLRFNSSRISRDNHTCPKNVCITMQSLYCSDTEGCRNDSQREQQSLPKLEHSCKDGYCRNVIKSVRYEFILNGTCGSIKSIDIRMELTDTSQSFHQSFEVVFKRTRGTSKNVYSRESSGYVVGDSILTGTVVKMENNTKNVISEYVKTNEPDFYLTVASRGRDGLCDSRKRRIVEFGEDARSGCNVNLTIDQFSTNSCIIFQSILFKHLLNDIMKNLTDIDDSNIYVSKTGDSTILDISNWTKILIDKKPRNVITGQINDDRLSCSGLVTSLNIDILYTVLPATNSNGNSEYKIAALSVTLSDPIDFYWSKCLETNCHDILKISILTIVSFNDISTPSMYHYAGGPNFDITLPYDFFYPFMSSADKPTNLLFLSIVGILISYKFS